MLAGGEIQTKCKGIKLGKESAFLRGVKKSSNEFKGLL